MATLSSQHATHHTSQQQPPEASMAIPQPTRYPHAFVWPIAAYVNNNYPLSTSHVQCVNPPPVRCNFQDSPPARKSAHKRRRRGGAHTNRKRKTSMSRVVTKATNRHHQPRNRAPPPPPRNTNKYLMAAAAARSKAEGIDDEVWDMEPSVLSPGRSSASTCFGGGTNEEEH